MKLNTKIKKIISDKYTPVSLYLLLRDHYQNPVLLESSDYSSRAGHFSYICLAPLAEITLKNDTIKKRNGQHEFSVKVESGKEILEHLNVFYNSFQYNHFTHDFYYAGIVGFMGYDAIPYFEEVSFTKRKEFDMPELYYAVYSLYLVFDHQTDSLFLISHGQSDTECDALISEVEEKIASGKTADYPFSLIKNETVNFSDEEFKNLLEVAKSHIQAGDVFQIVLSKRFSVQFKGDEFNVYRALRNLNPSPYLFYFDLGNYKLFGSSPEAQLVMDKNTAEIHPIAGTYRRTGNDSEDAIQAKKLAIDEKEKSEHMMLVDLARNDLSKYCTGVNVKSLAQIQFYSHVIHIVSKVSGHVKQGSNPFQVLTGTFPAGTLSGAPKHRAMQLINSYENVARQFYGGCIGFISHCGKVNHAIMIRTFLSQNYKLYYQAGAGIVINSEPESENNEIYNKTGALKKAIHQAEKFNNITKDINHEIISVG